MGDAREIAGRLTKAQRALLLKLPEPTQFGGWFGPKDVGTSAQALNNLTWFHYPEITSPPVFMLDRDYEDWPRLRYVWRLNETGLAVRAALAEG